MAVINNQAPEIVGGDMTEWFQRTFRAGSAFLDDPNASKTPALPQLVFLNG